MSEPQTLTGERIKRARESAMLTREELARKLGVHENSILNWELDRTVPAWPHHYRAVMNWLAETEEAA